MKIKFNEYYDDETGDIVILGYEGNGDYHSTCIKKDDKNERKRP